MDPYKFTSAYHSKPEATTSQLAKHEGPELVTQKDKISMGIIESRKGWSYRYLEKQTTILSLG